MLTRHFDSDSSYEIVESPSDKYRTTYDLNLPYGRNESADVSLYGDEMIAKNSDVKSHTDKINCVLGQVYIAV